MPIGDNFLPQLVEDARGRLETNHNQQVMLKSVLTALEHEDAGLTAILNGVAADTQLYIALEAFTPEAVKLMAEALANAMPRGEKVQAKPITEAARANQTAKPRARRQRTRAPRRSVRPQGFWRSQILQLLAAMEGTALNTSQMVDYINKSTGSNYDTTAISSQLNKLLKDNEIKKTEIGTGREKRWFYYVPVTEERAKEMEITNGAGIDATPQEIAAIVQGFSARTEEKDRLESGTHELAYTTSGGTQG